MALLDEIQIARQKVVTDGYDMSLGEIINLYKDKELVINPIFQRLFRWDDERKTRFVESLVLGIPVPPIFVYQNDNGVWELVDGLQRLSTVLQLTGDLEGEKAEQLGPLILNGTRFLPSLNEKRWKESSEVEANGLGQTLQIEIKRARIRVEILKSESDETAKFELFQRLNTGGASLTAQEVRNCIAVSLNKDVYDWIIRCSNNLIFKKTTDQTEAALESQAGVELVLRFFSFRLVSYRSGLDVHEYLDDALMEMATEMDFDMKSEEDIFNKTFGFLDEALGNVSFKRWNGKEFGGKFLMSVFEVMATGVSKNVENLEKMTKNDRVKFISESAKNLWSLDEFTNNSGAGVRGTTRLSRLLPISADLLNPEN